jgi:hypothetical protein
MGYRSLKMHVGTGGHIMGQLVSPENFLDAMRNATISYG